MEQVLLEKKGHKAYLILNRPEKLNALSMDMYRLIGKLLDEIEADDGNQSRYPQRKWQSVFRRLRSQSG